MKPIAVLLLLLILPGTLAAQAPGSAQNEEMKKLHFLVGEWKGEGWMEFGPGQRRTASVTESVQSKLGGEALLIQGFGTAEIGGKTVPVHDAIALVSFDPKTGYRFRAQKAGGITVDSELKMNNGALQWQFQEPRAGTVRFTFRLNENGQWFEIGEVSRDGTNWQKFFEMTLNRVK